MELDGPRHGAAPGSARSLVVFLHGLGADGDDLISLAPLLGQRLTHAAFVSPHAPFPCDMAPFGRQWFSLQELDPAALLGGVRLAAPVLDAFLDAELERHGLGDDRLALVGFSQGTMMALFVTLRRTNPCAAVVGYSGALIGAEALPEEIASRPPVLLVHGEADEIVPVAALPAAVAALRANSVPVESETRRGLGHGIDERGLALGAAFLARHLG
jgi:phospholipase/carboxylesterase